VDEITKTGSEERDVLMHILLESDTVQYLIFFPLDCICDAVSGDFWPLAYNIENFLVVLLVSPSQSQQFLHDIGSNHSKGVS
jgi:hypothetical protein